MEEGFCVKPTKKEIREGMRPFKCPNCGMKMYLEKTDVKYKGEKHDKWCCEDCVHITVLDNLMR